MNAEQCICGKGENCTCEQPCYPGDLRLMDEAASDPDRGHIFEIMISTSASPWPEAVKGVLPVVSAIQRMLESATAGRKAEFQLAQAEMENAAALWQGDLFGDSDD